MNKEIRDNVTAVLMLMMTIAVIGIGGFWVMQDIARNRHYAHLMHEAMERKDFDLWENDD